MECCQICGNLKEVWDFYDRIVPCPLCCCKGIDQKSKDQEDLNSFLNNDGSTGTEIDGGSLTVVK